MNLTMDYPVRSKVAHWFAYLLAIVAFLAGTAVGWANGEIRVRDILAPTEAAYRSQFHQGVYAACMALYGDPYNCNDFVGGALEYAVYGDPYWLKGYAGPQ